MNEELNCTEAQYQHLLKTNDTASIYGFIQKYGTGAVSLLHYADARGNFNNTKYKQDIIAQLIYSNLDSSSKLQVIQYMEDIEDGEF